MTTTRTFEADGMYGEATFDDAELYRYDLRRSWEKHQGQWVLDPGNTVAFLMLNPSTATEQVLDPTIRRCVGFAKAWGYSSLIVRNVFAYRSTDPKALKVHPDPVGPDNDAWLHRLLHGDAALVIAAYGTHATLYARDRAIRRAIQAAPARVCHLGTTKDGHPRHPLYLPNASTPQEFRP